MPKGSQPKLKVFLGMPFYGGINGHTVGSLVMTSALGFVRDVWIKPDLEQCTLVHRGRNCIIKRFVQSDFDYLLFVDSDMVWPAEVLWHLLAHKLDIVGGMYFRRVRPHHPVFAKHLNLTKDDAFEESAPPGPGLHEVAGVGMGFTLLSRRVCEKMCEKYPMPFQYMEVRGGEGELSEDYTFCHRAATEFGFKVHLDADLGAHLQHIGTAAFDAEDWMAYKRHESQRLISEEAQKLVRVATPEDVKKWSDHVGGGGNGKNRLRIVP